ncbi:methylamine utilization protein [Pseudoalteromonas phenolica]|uniref:methylamine utilization protein n=1 Tax=Pseudoalteromonas phenolica TaxID=161398 RepID=UPI0020162231|nr:methylamine utilization protein [Pseudoalteromonas phenolica]|tara:strand:+ start:219 stop:872 length:654 start_codon:yes stop_codon:yes gene_type:complete
MITNRLSLLFSLALCFVTQSHAFEVLIKDNAGNPLGNAVVWLEGDLYKPKAEQVSEMFSMGQKDRAFTPHILVVPTGAKIEFPNFDSILHHVYSFSKPKPFELKLYKETPKSEIVFENNGVIELGCNIHDWMLGYILVVDSGFYAITDAQGIANIALSPSQIGSAQLHVWHERFEKLEDSEQVKIHLSSHTQNETYKVKQSLMEVFDFEVDESDGYE